MTQVRFIGDVHGKFRRYRDVIRNSPHSIQVGDMGIGFPTRTLNDDGVPSLSAPPYDSMSRGRHLFIRGNHDAPNACARHPYWIKDGAVVDGVYCLGGAVSVDKEWRTEGVDYWSDEELSYAALEAAIDDYASIKPDVVCTHDCPESVANEIMLAFNKAKFSDGSRTRVALERMLAVHRPRYWVFGHWHHGLRFEREGTTFHCLGELEFADVEI